MRMLQTQAPEIFSFAVFILMRFLPSTPTRYVRGFVLTFKSVFNENAQRISVDGRLKRIEMYAFTNENALVWTGPEIIKEQLLISHKDRAPLTFTLR